MATHTTDSWEPGDKLVALASFKVLLPAVIEGNAYRRPLVLIARGTQAILLTEPRPDSGEVRVRLLKHADAEYCGLSVVTHVITWGRLLPFSKEEAAKIAYSIPSAQQMLFIGSTVVTLPPHRYLTPHQRERLS